MGKKLFDYVIGNPPYQDDTVGDQKRLPHQCIICFWMKPTKFPIE